LSDSLRQVLWAFGFAGLGVSKEIDLLPLREEVERSSNTELAPTNAVRHSSRGWPCRPSADQLRGVL
jgi:hypothetical protein